MYKVTIEEHYLNPKDPYYKRFHNLKYIEKVADNIGSLTRDNENRGAESTNDVPTTIKVADMSADALSVSDRSGGSANDNTATEYNVSDLYSFVKMGDENFTSILKNIEKVADLPNGVSETFVSLSGDKSATNEISELANGVHSENGGLTEASPEISINSISDLYKLVKEYNKDFTSKEVNPALLNED